MTELVELLRTIAREMAEDDQPPSWHIPIVSAADEIVALRAELATLKSQLEERGKEIDRLFDEIVSLEAGENI